MKASSVASELWMKYRLSSVVKIDKAFEEGKEEEVTVYASKQQRLVIPNFVGAV